MTSTTVSTLRTTSITLKTTDSVTITGTGQIKPASGPAVVWSYATPDAAGVAVDNSGVIAPTSGRAFDTAGTPNATSPASSATGFTLINHTGASISATSDVMRVQSSVNGGFISFDNSGSMIAGTGGSGRGINVQDYTGLSSFSITNRAGALFQSVGDTVRLTSLLAGTAFNGTLTIDNSGTIRSTGTAANNGQALDLNDVNASGAGHTHIINRAGGVIEAADADAVRPGAYGLVDNYGTIQAKNGTASSTGNDGIDFQANAGGIVNNYQGGAIIGAHHGIAGAQPVEINNDGTITGQLGSGINLDTGPTTTTFITNTVNGVISGNASGTSDGDGIDVDGEVFIENYGTINGFGTWNGGLSEAITVGGGSIHNYAGGVIYSDQRAITVDDSNLGGAFTQAVILNAGTITSANGEAISITGTFSDAVDNTGTINGNVMTGDGGDFITNGGTINGVVYAGAGDDIISVYGNGHDSGIYGEAGFDTLFVDYSGTTGGYYYNQIYADGAGGFAGALYNSSGGTFFGGMEALHVTMTDDDNYLSVDTSPLASGATLDLDGGLGNDTLQIDFSQIGDTQFTVAPDGSISSNQGSYAGFETFYVTLGNGDNSVATGAGADTISGGTGTNILSGGAGNDTIYSNGGVDQVDGGADTDSWYGNYSASTMDLDFSYSGTLGSLSNGTVLSNIEYVQLTTGSGNDSANLSSTSSIGYFDGGAGHDSLTVDNSGTSGGYYYGSVSSNGAGGFAGTVYGPLGSTSFNNVEALDITLADDDNYLYVDTSPLASGATLDLDGGLGNDTLQIDFSQLGDTQFTVTPNGSISSNHGSYAGFESFNVSLGGGTNSVTTGAATDTIIGGLGSSSMSGGAGNDTIYTVGGVDHVDGGADYDTWYGGYTGSTADLTFNFSGTSGSLSNGTTLANIEYIGLSTGSGNDSAALTATSVVGYFDAGAGIDSLTVDYSGSTGGYYYGSVSSDGAGGFAGTVYGPQGSTSFNNVETLDITLTDDDNYLYVDASSSLLGASLFVDGGVGSDTVQTSGLLSGYSIIEDGLGGYTVTDMDASDGDHGQFTVRNFEFLQFDDQQISLPAYGTGITYTGTTGPDARDGTAFDDSFTGLAGNDVFNGLGGSDLFNGGDGDDTLNGGGGVDTATYIDAIKGVKVDLNLTTQQNTVGAGKDILTGIENLTGSTFNDTLTGDGNVNRLDGGLGNDKLFGQGSDDQLTGGDGNDTLDGGIGQDILSGGIGNDKLYGQDGNDQLDGGDGIDRLDGGIGGDTMSGGIGNDKYWVDDALDQVIEVAGLDALGKPLGGVDTVYSSIGYTLGADVENLVLLDGFGPLSGIGNGLNNALTGNDGDNLLNGGAGKDALTGGLGADIFQLDVLTTSALKDTIKDFVSGEDHVELSMAAFGALAGYGAGALSAGELTFGTKATAVDQHLIYNSANGGLYYDADGVGGAAQVQIASFANHAALTAGDFILI